MNTPTPHQNIKEKGNKKPSVTKVIQSLKESGSEQTFKWYADCTGMFLKEAAIEVAQKVFRYSETYTYDIEDVKDVSLCKALWSKYFDDEDIMEIISIAMKKERDERYNEIYSHLRNINIHYLYVDSFIDSLYIVFPELRRREKMSELQSEKMVRKRLCCDISKNIQFYEDVKVDKGNNISQKEDINSEMLFVHEEPTFASLNVLHEKKKKEPQTSQQIEAKEMSNPIVSDEQICAKFREGKNIYNVVGWYSNITGKGIEESKDIIVRLLFDRSDMVDYANEVLLNTDYYNYIMEGTTPSPESKSDKNWGWLIKTVGIILASFVLFVIFSAIGNAGMANTLFFIFVLGGSYSIVWGMSERNNSRIFGYIMSLIITIIALCAIWNAAFNWES